MRTLYPLVAALATLAIPAVAAPLAPAVFERAIGGAVADPLTVDATVYLATGTTLTAWDYSNPAAPVLTGSTHTTPARGMLTSLARRGDYVYAAFNAYDDDVAGVAVYGIADRAHPQLVAQVTDYTTAAFREARSVVVANDHLYMFDTENGVYVSPLSNPAQPVFTHAIQGYGAYHHIHADGSRLTLTGRNWIDQTTIDIFDIGTPLAPQRLGGASLDGFDNFRVQIKPPYAIGFGIAIAITDLSNPASIAPRGRVDAPLAYNGVVIGDTAYGVGGDGIDAWNIANPDAPAPLGHTAIETFATDVTATTGTAAILATRTDRLVRFDAPIPGQPVLASATILPVGTSARDIGWRGDRALILGNAYGLNVADARTLAPSGRFETTIPQSLQARAFEQLELLGNRAYMTSWGSGLVIADITNPYQPTQVGLWEYAYATALAVSGTTAYVGRSTNGGELVVVDVADPANPQAHGTLTTSKISRLLHRDHYVFIADDSFAGPGGGGLRIVDVANRDLPVQVGYYGACDAGDVALDRAGRIALLACHDQVHVLDVSNRASPTWLGTYTGAGSAVAIHGTRAYIGNDLGVHEIDVTNPAAPAFVGSQLMATNPRRIRVGPDAKVYAFGDPGGLYVYAPDRLFRDGVDGD